jgi:hypothetical protein
VVGMYEHGGALTCRSGRSVPISSQLRSHRLFSENWERLAYLVDAATLYHTGKHMFPSSTPHGHTKGLQHPQHTLARNRAHEPNGYTAVSQHTGKYCLLLTCLDLDACDKTIAGRGRPGPDGQQRI